MIKLKRFNESVSGNRLTKEDLEEYFIDFIDTKDMSFIKSTYFQGNKYIKSLFSIGDSFVMRDSYSRNQQIVEHEDLVRFSEILSRLSSICRQWNLEFALKFGGSAIEQLGVCLLEIRQRLPDDVIEHLVYRTAGFGADSDSFYHTTMIGDKSVKFHKKLAVNENNELFAHFTNCTVSPPSYKMTARERTMWATMDNDVIHYFENDFPVKMQFIKKGEPDRKEWDSKSFIFKILS